MRSNNQIIIFDTTLRDGEQSPGATMSPEQKTAIAPNITAENLADEPEQKLLLQRCAPRTGARHVLIHRRNLHVEVQAEMKHSATEQDDKDGEGSVLEVGDLHFHCPELHPPPDVAVCRGRLEAHAVPVGACTKCWKKKQVVKQTGNWL